MKQIVRQPIGLLLILLVFTSPAFAGMGVRFRQLILKDVAQMRLESLSFFIVFFFVLALLVQIAWNTLGKDFPHIPRLSYLRALTLLFLLSLMMAVVLSMINGARELMTPGAWEYAGSLYRVADGAAKTPAQQLIQARQTNMERLRETLWHYADTHDNRLPPHQFVKEIPAEFWRTLLPNGKAYYYYAGQIRGEPPHMIACEPDEYSEQRFVLLSNGDLRQVGEQEFFVFRFEVIKP